MSNTPSDAEIIELMRDGYNCRYNDEADHIEFARAVLAKWAAPQPAPAPLSDDVSQKTWALLDELEKLRGADRYDEDWDTLNKRDDELRAALAAQGGKA